MFWAWSVFIPGHLSCLVSGQWSLFWAQGQSIFVGWCLTLKIPWPNDELASLTFRIHWTSWSVTPPWKLPVRAQDNTSLIDTSLITAVDSLLNIVLLTLYRLYCIFVKQSDCFYTIEGLGITPFGTPAPIHTRMNNKNIYYHALIQTTKACQPRQVE